MLTVTDFERPETSKSVIVFPDKVNLTFDATPPGLTLYVDGIAHVGSFVYDTLVGFHHTIEARNQTIGSTTYTFASWSDGGAQQHTITAPSASQSSANYTATVNQAPPALVQVSAATPQSNQSQVASDTYASPRPPGTPTSSRSAGTIRPPTSPR